MLSQMNCDCACDCSTAPNIVHNNTAQRKINTSHNRKGKSKPKWAMTEDEELDVELDEAKELLDFAANLDYDKYMKDVEVQQAIAAMKERVKEIAAADGVDLEHLRDHKRECESDDGFDDAISECSVTSSEAALPPSERRIRMAQKMEIKRKNRAAARAAGEVGNGWDRRTKIHAELRAAVEKDALELAEKLLKTSPGLSSVHSKQSLARLLKDVTFGKISDHQGIQATHKTAFPDQQVSFQAPVISVVDGAQGGEEPKRILTELRHSKTYVQNLPYMYRCPSI